MEFYGKFSGISRDPKDSFTRKVIFKLKFRLMNISNKNINLVSCVYLQKGVKCQMFLETTREKSGCLENWLFCSQRIIDFGIGWNFTHCSKIGKMCNFKNA